MKVVIAINASRRNQRHENNHDINTFFNNALCNFSSNVKRNIIFSKLEENVDIFIISLGLFQYQNVEIFQDLNILTLCCKLIMLFKKCSFSEVDNNIVRRAFVLKINCRRIFFEILTMK